MDEPRHSDRTTGGRHFVRTVSRVTPVLGMAAGWWVFTIFRAGEIWQRLGLRRNRSLCGCKQRTEGDTLRKDLQNVGGITSLVLSLMSRKIFLIWRWP